MCAVCSLVVFPYIFSLPLLSHVHCVHVDRDAVSTNAGIWNDVSSSSKITLDKSEITSLFAAAAKKEGKGGDASTPASPTKKERVRFVQDKRAAQIEIMLKKMVNMHTYMHTYMRTSMPIYAAEHLSNHRRTYTHSIICTVCSHTLCVEMHTVRHSCSAGVDGLSHSLT